MLRNVLVAFCSSREAFVEPLAIQARTLEQGVSVERLERGARAGILSEILHCESYLP
jgi:hypothetical protein